MFFQSVITICLALLDARLVEASPLLRPRQECTFETILPSKNLTWCPCYGDNFSCALLDVPLDYANPTGRRAFVPFIRFAANGNSSGVIMSNPGGPGESGVQSFLNQALLYSEIIGNNYDFVSFDPRGVGFSIPSANCSNSPKTAAPLIRRFADRLHGPRFTPQFFLNSYKSYLALGQQCRITIGGETEAGPYMNSAVVARDMASFLDAYARSEYSHGVVEPHVLNYFGFSYGTYLGQVFANMYPNRVGRFALDSVIDAAANLAGRELNGTFADEAFSTFFVYCNLAGPGSDNTHCPYYTGTTSNHILARFEATLAKLNPIVAKLKGWANATVIELTLEAVKQFSADCAYYPIPLPGSNLSDPTIPNFPNLALFLIDVEAAVKNLTTAKYMQLQAKYGLDVAEQPLEWAAGIQCSDNGNILYRQSLLRLGFGILSSEAQSYMNGEYLSTLKIRCAGWPIVGKGRYLGPFGGATKNPILFISNTRDPVLPLQNGQNAASLYHGAQLVTIDGTGHTSPAALNNCAFAVYQSWFQTGALPQGNPFGFSNNFCPLEAGPWGVLAPPGALKKRGLEEIASGLKTRVRAE